jgi:DNA-binding NarL/FixJ family response regulator
MQRFKVLLNTSDTQWMHGISAAFEECPQFEVIENPDPQVILEQTSRVLPEIILWKIENEDEEVIYQVLNQCPQAMMVLVVNDPNLFNVTQLMRMGVSGCLPKRLLPRQIVTAVELIVITGILCFPRLSKSHRKAALDSKQMAIPPDLTLREREILEHLCRNQSNQEIAAALCLAESTVKTHLQNIFRKMGINKRGEAIAALYQNGSARYSLERRDTNCS